jgi:integrase
MLQKTSGPHLRVLHCATMARRGYTLPSAWEGAIGGWLSWLRLQGLRETTLRTRRGQVRAIARQSRTRHPREIDIACLVRLCAKPGVSADHRHGQRAALTSFYQWCVDNDVVRTSPAALLPKVKASPPMPRPAPDEVWSALLTSARPREALMALLACEAGLRRAEVAGLHYDDLVRDQTGWLLIIRGKGGKQRVVPITTGLASRLRSHCHGGYVFPGKIDGHLSPDAVGRLVSRLMPDGYTMHKLRHRFATRGFNGTHNLLAVQEALGHSSVATTQRYTAITLTDIRAVSEAAAQDWSLT